MSPMLCHMRHMARGQSGRIVLEIDPALKRAVHARLAGDGVTMKDWFLEQVEHLLNPKQQHLPLIEPSYRAKADGPAMKAAEPKRPTYARRTR